jgi:hypothetical protein
VSGCITSDLQDSIRKGDYRAYTESIDSVLISADGKTLVFLGQKYHYIFDAPDTFSALLDSPLHERMRAQVGLFSVDEAGVVRGGFDIELKDVSPGEETRQAIELGFHSKTMARRISLKGRRYSADGFDLSKVNQRMLLKTYQVSVREKNPLNGKKALYVLTPITVALDGTLMILSIPLLPIAYLMLRNARWM